MARLQTGLRACYLESNGTGFDAWWEPLDSWRGYTYASVWRGLARLLEAGARLSDCYASVSPVRDARGFASFGCGPASKIRVDFLIVTTQTKFGVGLVQMAVSRNPQDNLARAIAKIEEAGRNGAQVVCLPELFQSQYFCQREDTANFDLAEAVPGPTTESLSTHPPPPEPSARWWPQHRRFRGSATGGQVRPQG